MEINALVNYKILSLESYFREWNIKSVVLGMSGGIDSAFVYELLKEVSKKYPITIHTMFFKHGIHKHEASESIILDYVNIKNHTTMDISNIIDATNNVDWNHIKHIDTQYAYALMYTLMFRKAQQKNAVTIGTTNKDEFNIGWFGKNSDMVVDIQPILDIHKYQIYESNLAKNIPMSILNKAPTGDLISGLTDEEIFGCSYKEISNILNDTEINYDDIKVKYPKLFSVMYDNRHKKQKNTFNPIVI